ncbi:amino acid:proton symporter, ABT family [Desulfurobacterium pacificum]|uniref:Amino acid:proton symporter, ABT family n=1 Tax=Desulfurobacterium pacificum TaxID=240166 RepID=A0ABY1NJ39_9BACT|nr:APC family permease [Desulfurobacterium pacificum]SMP10651.1 amino acid:proton symporter, ABT family [Desulfurobacterium pacificum]
MKKEGKLTLLQAIAMAVGTMIGASIFSIFGYGVKIAGTGLPFAFFLSGIYALMVAYSYAYFGKNFVSNAGPIAFIEKGFGDSPIVGALSILMWMSFVVSISLFAISFSGYFIPLVHLNNSFHPVVEVLIIALFGALNYSGGSRLIGRLEFWIVLFKLLVLLTFVAAAFYAFHPEYLKFNTSPQFIKGILTASVVFFLSYMGFGIVTNDSENIENPQLNVPRAIYISIFIVMAVYVAVSLAALGSLPAEELVKYRENALAVAAQPVLGNFGYFLLSIGALASITSALNATLYSGANAAYALMKKGYIPHPEMQRRREWMGEHFGLYLTCTLALLFTLLFNVTSVASIISIITTVIYIGVIVSHLRLADRIGGRKGIIFFNLIVITFVAFQIILFQLRTNKLTFIVTVLVFLVSYLLEKFYYGKRREIRLLTPKG